MNEDLDAIKNKVEEKFEADILSKSRKREVVNAKKAFFYLSEKLTHKSNEQMGGFIGLDRTTSMHHLRDKSLSAESIMKFDKEFKNLIQDCEFELIDESRFLFGKLKENN